MFCDYYAATWIWHNSTIHNWFCPTWKAHCKLAFQDVWKNQYCPCSLFLIWPQTWALHENSTTVYVHSSGIFCSWNLCIDKIWFYFFFNASEKASCWQALLFFQVVGTFVAGTVNLAVAWWMLENIENICDVEAQHPDSPWTCPKYRVTFDASVIWGLIGPRRLFGPGGLYRNLVWLFLIGAVLPVPVWVLSKIFPEKKWIPLINIPVISYGFAGMPPATPTNIASWLITGTIFNYFVFKWHKRWWQKYNYVLSAALDAGTAFMGVLLFFALQNENRNLKWWGTALDHCPLATCPTAPGIVVKGCPVFN